jgi:uncharacterized protein YjbJ (UPF0337 family)
MSMTDRLKGKAKEAVGSVTGSDGLREEGLAQQRKASEMEKAELARKDAERHGKLAEGHEASERDKQGT